MAQPVDDKELVIGNKQLISLFFVVVALCGVFFAMGYMIGRNSGKASLSSADSQGSSSSGRSQSEPPRETAQPAPDAASSAPPLTESAPASAVGTKPAQDTQPAPPVNAAPAPQAYSPEPKTPPQPQPRGVSEPEAGASYLQVTALPRADAEGVVKTLREQNFPTILAASSKDGLFRVLVGPYHQTSQLADTKSRLKAMGFGSAFVQKQ